MVRYTGGMKRITGAVNTIQRGLKMSGCPSRVGRSPTNSRSISQRVKCNISLKYLYLLDLAILKVELPNNFFCCLYLYFILSYSLKLRFISRVFNDINGVF